MGKAAKRQGTAAPRNFFEMKVRKNRLPFPNEQLEVYFLEFRVHFELENTHFCYISFSLDKFTWIFSRI